MSYLFQVELRWKRYATAERDRVPMAQSVEENKNRFFAPDAWREGERIDYLPPQIISSGTEINEWRQFVILRIREDRANTSDISGWRWGKYWNYLDVYDWRVVSQKRVRLDDGC